MCQVDKSLFENKDYSSLTIDVAGLRLSTLRSFHDVQG